MRRAIQLGSPYSKDSEMFPGEGARILCAIAGLGQQFSCANDPTFLDDSTCIAVAVNAPADATAGFLAGSDWYDRKWDVQTLRTKFLNEPAPSAICFPPDLILWAHGLADAAELCTGFGSPCTGDALESASNEFSAVHTQLGKAFPDAGWRSSAAEFYANQNGLQESAADRLAQLDLQLAADLNGHADTVNNVRIGFGSLKNLLIAAYYYDLHLVATAPLIVVSGGGFTEERLAENLVIERAVPAQTATDFTAAERFAQFAAWLGLCATIGLIVSLDDHSHTVKRRVHRLTTQYRALAAESVTSTGISAR